MEIEQAVNKRKKITRLLLILLIILLSLVCIKYLISKSNKYISENGKSSMGAVVEQIQQTYDLQVSGYYSQLQLVEEFLLHERELSLETDTNKSFFEAWEKESESTLIFLQENGQAISAGGTKMRIDMPSKFLLDLKNGYNIGKLVRLDYDQKKKDGYLVAIPCQEYTINGETYTAIGTVYDHSKLDSMLKLKGYDGKAYLFMLDDDGNITYTNQSGDKYLRNYSLLKHLKGEQAITEEEADLFKKKFDNRESGVALLGKQNPYYLGYCPIESNNTILVCIVAKGVVDNVLMLLQDNIEKKKMTLQVDMDRLPKESVYGDATRILEILLNLASNAVKYTPEGGTIRFLAEKREEIGSDQIYRFVVQDNGIGMSKEFLEKLFEPFAREQKVADGKFEGTGLGMSITKAFVEMMGGDIRVDSKEGEGTTFEVLLRFKKAEAAVVEELGKVWTMDECRGRFAQNRLLLAEDNELNREILKELIRETGISIEEAVNGKEAVRLVQNNPEDYFDLVFMDVQMPEMDGYEAAGRIRQYEKKLKRKHLPIIALTANVFAEDSERALRAGMDAHMGKPVEVPQLLATMMHWIG